MKWTKKVKHGVNQVGVKEGKEAPRKPCQTRDIDFVLLSPTPANCMCFNFFPLFHPHLHTRNAGARTRERTGEGG